MRRWYLIGLLAAGCAAHPQAEKPAPPEPRSADEAAERLDEAERALQAALLRGDASLEGKRTDDDDSPGVAAGRGEAERLGTDRCTRACRALASMERSAERLCALAGDGDHRCRSAQERLEAARRLVAVTCPRCLDD
jgi:hypothetical protein